MSPQLREVRLPVVPNAYCEEVYGRLENNKAVVIGNGHICCGFKDGGKDACQVRDLNLLH